MRKSFLLTWRGRVVSVTDKKCVQNQCASARGSRLTDDDRKILAEGGVVFFGKGTYRVKFFMKDEDGKLWSVIIDVMDDEFPGFVNGLEKNAFAVGDLRVQLAEKGYKVLS